MSEGLRAKDLNTGLQVVLQFEHNVLHLRHQIHIPADYLFIYFLLSENLPEGFRLGVYS